MIGRSQDAGRALGEGYRYLGIGLQFAGGIVFFAGGIFVVFLIFGLIGGILGGAIFAVEKGEPGKAAPAATPPPVPGAPA